jgi:hypothetical protein
VVYALGLGAFDAEKLAADGAVPLCLLVSAGAGTLAMGVLALFEDIGWRGFLVPALARLVPAGSVAPLSGLAWAALLGIPSPISAATSCSRAVSASGTAVADSRRADGEGGGGPAASASAATAAELSPGRVEPAALSPPLSATASDLGGPRDRDADRAEALGHLGVVAGHVRGAVGAHRHASRASSGNEGLRPHDRA